MKKMSTLSVVMIIKNEADKLSACLDSVRALADEIIILDSGSTDDSEKIARRYGAKWFVNTDWQGFGKQRQVAQNYASCDYILALDADEVLNTRLQQSITEVLKKPVETNEVYWLKRDNYFFNYPIYRYSWHKPKVARLYARKVYHYSDHEVHESLETQNARALTLKGCIEHKTNDSAIHFLRKNLRYSDDWARGKAGKPTNLLLIYLKSFYTFVRLYFFRGGFLGGGYGLIHAVATMHYTYNKYLILYEANRYLLKKSDS